MTTMIKENDIKKHDTDQAKQFLSAAGRYDELRRLKQEQLDYLMKVARDLYAPSDLFGKRFMEGFVNNENTLCEIITLRKRMADEIDRLITAYEHIKTAIAEVENKEYRILLELRYLTYKTWEEIALDMNYSLRHIMRMHEKALCALCETNFFIRNIE